ncbi:hypothetical protein DFH06DRAFT_1150412 [Mycena polygramma]|nr:hypothetical protein DFH06DRAFT_1150412 [Mycena polygramma]
MSSSLRTSNTNVSLEIWTGNDYSFWENTARPIHSAWVIPKVHCKDEGASYQTSTTMPASAIQRCGDDEERRLRRLATYRKYRRAHLDERRKKGRERMARLRATPTEADRERHRAAQRRYRDSFREQIAHRARRAAAEKNSALGKETKLRPKSRQYWSDPELASESEEEDDTECIPYGPTPIRTSVARAVPPPPATHPSASPTPPASLPLVPDARAHAVAGVASCRVFGGQA